MAKRSFLIGTRGSDLAMKQTRWVCARMRRTNPDVEFEIKIVRTTGDEDSQTALTEMSSTGIFTRQIERSLLAGQIDLAVHSLKDLPVEIAPGLIIGAIPDREDPADVLISKAGESLEKLPEKATILCGSLRRRAQLLHRRRDLNIIGVRGNVPTRLKKLRQGNADALVLAAAGLRRLGCADQISQRFDPEDFLPACGQGALAIQIRTDDSDMMEFVKPLDNADVRAAVTAERVVLARLEGGCHVPIGALGWIDRSRLMLRAMIADLEGKKLFTAEASGSPDDPVVLGIDVAGQLLDQGADDILNQIRSDGHIR